jgi:hypothetical protein
MDSRNTLAPSSRIDFVHATMPEARITCYAVGDYSMSVSRAQAAPIMRCFLSAGANAGVVGTPVPLGTYHSEQSGLRIECDSVANSSLCRIRRSESSAAELPGSAAFLVDCSAAMKGVTSEPCPVDPAAATAVNARTSSDPMIRDSVSLGDSEGTARTNPAISPADMSHLTCMHMLTRRPVDMTVYSTGPAEMLAETRMV